MDPNVGLAVENNARWCDVVCRSHHITTSWHNGFWVTRESAPRFYPEAITLRENVRPERLIEELPRGVCSVKDSFADLDLASHGFEQLLEGRWIHRAPASGPAPTRTWTVVRTKTEFARWLDVCGLAGVLSAALLRAESVRILQRKRGQDVSAGAVLNRTGPVVGVTNLFSSSAALDEVWRDVAGLSEHHFPSCPIVGYERGEHLEAAIDAGFDDLAALRVWVVADLSI